MPGAATNSPGVASRERERSMQSIPELVRRALVVLLVVLVTMRVIVSAVEQAAPRRSPARPPRGLEWRTIKRLPAGRIFAVRLQVVLV